MNDNELRTQVKILKAIGQIDTLGEVAEMINISLHSFYNWLNGYYNLSNSKKILLKNIIDNLIID